MEQEVARIIRTHTADAETAAMSNAVQEALAARNVERVVEAFPWDSTAETLNQTASTFGQVIQDSIGTGFPKVGFKGRFDYTDPRTIEWAKNQSAQLVTAVTDNMRNIIRTTVAESFTQGVTVRDTARKLSRFIGLNDRQAMSFAKFESGLAEKVAARTITEQQAAKMIDAQYKKMIKYRSQMIARQEIAMAEAHGRWLGFEQAIEQGWAHPKSMKRWSASSDERTCEICGPMNGKSVVWNEPFPNGVYREPAHIMCRCTTTLLEPDSALAQSFMAPAKVAPPVIDIPMPLLPTIPIGNLKAPQDAIDEAHNRASGVSTFQYDAGQIENLNVTTEAVIFNGTPHTEIRMKLTDSAKTRLTQAAEKSIAKDDGMWSKADAFLLIDRKAGKKITFAEIPSDVSERHTLRRTVYNSTEGGASFVDEDLSSKTFTRYMPNGTAIRVVVSKEAYAYDGMVRVMIPGRATPVQIEAVMKELGVTANRLPSDVDIENMKQARIISLFTPKFGSTLTKAPIEIKKQIDLITKTYGFTLDEVVTELDADGALRFLLPERVAKELAKTTGVKSMTHSLGGYLYDIPQDEKNQRIANFFIGNAKLLSNVQRKGRGTGGMGISEAEDVKTGGADYVFIRPTTKGLDDAGRFSGTIVFNPENLLRRTDWFAYAGDSYGVKNPKYFGRYFNGYNRENLNYIEELTSPSGRAEVMFQDAVDTKDIHSIVVDPETRDGALAILKGLGIDEWYGRKIEDVIILAQEYR
jgi:SPP1 gp7 family putative phage head morphogenesis protein